MGSPSRHRPGKLREQMCGVAPLIACAAHSRDDKKSTAIIGAFLLIPSRKNYQSLFSSKATACLNWYPIEN
jgi:hypothetical protein